jgi:hypothetical protein
MPRFYNLTIVKPDAKVGDQPYRRWTSNPGSGTYDPGALDVEFDTIVAPFSQPTGGSPIRVYGIALDDLLQAEQFAGTAPGNGMILTLYGGMSAGLPLANPKQSGLLFQGQIVQSYGNWLGTEMTLDFVIKPSAYTPESPGNIVLVWRAGQTLQSALASTLSIAYPGVKQNFSISDQLLLNHDEVGPYSTLESLSQTIMRITQGQIVSDDYFGVAIVYQGGQLYIFDRTIAPPSPTQIAFNDLIGQPTWIDVNTMQMTTVLRSDLVVGSGIMMPKIQEGAPSVVQTTAASFPNSLKYKSAFQGPFQVTQVRHTGRLRAPDAQSWVSVFNCVAGLVGS